MASTSVEEDREFLQRCSTGAGQYDRVRVIVYFEVFKRNSDKMPVLSDKVSDGYDCEDAASASAEDEVADLPDRFPFVIYNRSQFQQFGMISLGHLFGIERNEGHFL